MKTASAGIPIIVYHNIDNRREWGINTITPLKFRDQMQFLRDSGFQTIDFRDVITGKIPANPLILTFDDGYESFYHHALPVLVNLHFKCVVFIISQFIGKENTWDVNLGGIRFKHLDEKQISEISRQGIEIGSHGMTHRALTYLSDLEIRKELKYSRKSLQNLSGQQVISIAYPFGLQNKNVRELARETGYLAGCINLWGKTSEKPLTCSRRIPVYRTDSTSALKRKVSSGFFYSIEVTKLKIFSWSARLTPLYQQLFRSNISTNKQ